MNNKSTGVFVVFTTPQNEVLMLSRRDGIFSPKSTIHYVAGVLELPGGTQDPTDGSIEETAEREVGEETGFAIDKDKLEPVGVFNGSKGPIYFYHYRLTSDEKITMEANLKEAVEQDDSEHARRGDHPGFYFHKMEVMVALLDWKQRVNGHELRYVLTLPGDVAVHVLHERCNVPLPEGKEEWKGTDNDFAITPKAESEMKGEHKSFRYQK